MAPLVYTQKLGPWNWAYVVVEVPGDDDVIDSPRVRIGTAMTERGAKLGALAMIERDEDETEALTLGDLRAERAKNRTD